MPGVEHVGVTDAPPLSGRGASGMFLILDRPDEVQSFDDWMRIMENPNRTGEAEYRWASGDYFRAMGIPLVAGRLFDERDHADAPHVAVISESLARTRWPGEDPIGKLIQFGNMDGDLRAMTIVGVVGDVRHESLEAEPLPTFYGNALQRPVMGRVSVVISGPDARAAIGPARAAAQSLDPTIPVRFEPIEDYFSYSLAGRRFSMVLLGIFAVVALFVAAAGLYGVISYLVAQRTRRSGSGSRWGAAGGRDRLVVGQGPRCWRRPASRAGPGGTGADASSRGWSTASGRRTRRRSPGPACCSRSRRWRAGSRRGGRCRGSDGGVEGGVRIRA